MTRPSTAIPGGITHEQVLEADPKKNKGKKLVVKRIKTFDELFGELAVTNEEIKDMKETTMAIDGLLVESHLAIWVAKPNGGKSALARYAAKILASNGYQVFYVDVDSAMDGIVFHQNFASKYGYTLVAPNIKTGKSNRGRVENNENTQPSRESWEASPVYGHTEKVCRHDEQEGFKECSRPLSKNDSQRGHYRISSPRQ